MHEGGIIRRADGSAFGVSGGMAMKQVIVLAMHGAPPNDFPRGQVGEFFGLHGRLEQVSGPERERLQRRHDELEAEMRAWPRTAENDRFWAASLELGAHLGEATGQEVLVGFNEFCAPSLDEALDQAVESGAEQITVVTPMMTRGGEHSEVDIPAAVRRAQKRHPGVTFRYVWPFKTQEVARFLAAQIERSNINAPL
jgi:sirohydrochlorin cobaltochelatase